MKISIITACFNSQKHIESTFKSLQSQTYSNIEYIVIDGGSTDRTIEIINKYRNIISHYVSEPDQGIYDALNKGIKIATGDVIGFLHSDDLFFSNNIVEKIVDKFSEEKCDAIYGDLKYVSESDSSKVIRFWKSGEYNRNKLKSGWMPPHPTFYMRRSLYKKLGCFDLSFKISSDYDSLLRYLWVNKISLSYLSEVLILMRVGGISNRSWKNIFHKSKEDMKALRKNGIPYFKALVCKNILKISQYIIK